MSNVVVTNANLENMMIDGVTVKALFEAYSAQNPDGGFT